MNLWYKLIDVGVPWLLVALLVTAFVKMWRDPDRGREMVFVFLLVFVLIPLFIYLLGKL